MSKANEAWGAAGYYQGDLVMRRYEGALKGEDFVRLTAGKSAEQRMAMQFSLLARCLGEVLGVAAHEGDQALRNADKVLLRKTIESLEKIGSMATKANAKLEIRVAALEGLLRGVPRA